MDGIYSNVPTYTLMFIHTVYQGTCLLQCYHGQFKNHYIIVISCEGCAIATCLIICTLLSRAGGLEASFGTFSVLTWTCLSLAFVLGLVSVLGIERL